jgi:hypothetical protein
MSLVVEMICDKSATQPDGRPREARDSSGRPASRTASTRRDPLLQANVDELSAFLLWVARVVAAPLPTFPQENVQPATYAPAML